MLSSFAAAQSPCSPRRCSHHRFVCQLLPARCRSSFVSAYHCADVSATTQASSSRGSILSRASTATSSSGAALPILVQDEKKAASDGDAVRRVAAAAAAAEELAPEGFEPPVP